MDKTTSPQAANFVLGIREELKKVNWPSRREAMRLTAAVFFISLIVAGYIGIIDFLLAKVLAILTRLK